MNMKILDTLTEKKKELSKDQEIKLFVCGPTVYDYPHIGHARTYVAFDIIVHYLRSRGFKVFYLQNITDVDDKIIERAGESGKDPLELAAEFENFYHEDMKALSVDTVDRHARASDYIDEIIRQVGVLVKRGFAYETEKGVYFSVRKFGGYGKLSRQDIDSLQSGRRVEKDTTKNDPLDFVLWKKTAIADAENKKGEPIIINGEPLWSSPWGRGRPGWHIEDTAITEKVFGSQYDIHGGAEDLKFPHHEAEIAQQESASGKEPFVNVWMHAGILYVNGEKMSKSLKNFITIRDFLKDNHPEILRWIVFTHHYRSKIDYTKDLIIQAKSSLETIVDFMERLNFIGKSGKEKDFPSGNLDLEKLIDNLDKEFHGAMEDDFNTPKAVAAVYSFINSVKKHIWSVSPKQAEITKRFLVDTIKLARIKIDFAPIPDDIKALAEEREKSRANQQFIKSDEIRDKIFMLGYEVEDTPLGQLIRKKR